MTPTTSPLVSPATGSTDFKAQDCALKRPTPHARGLHPAETAPNRWGIGPEKALDSPGRGRQNGGRHE